MKKFLEKLYEDFPELLIDKEKVDKLVYFLDKNKPFIEPSKEFKINLKSRLDSYIGLKQNKKISFLAFTIPVFSFCFIIAGFLYYYQSLDKINNIDLVSVNIYDENGGGAENLKISRMMTFELDESYDIEDSDIMETNYENDIVLKIVEDIEFFDGDSVQDIEVFEESSKKSIGTSTKDDISIENDTSYEDEKLAFGSGGGFSDDDYSGGESVMMMSMFADESYEMELSFSDYCDENGGELTQDDSGELTQDDNLDTRTRKCTIENKICLEKNYLNGYCEFEEKK